MSAVAIQGALEQALAAITPAIHTVAENEDDDPVMGKPGPDDPYQRITCVFADPNNDEISPRYTEQGYLEVLLLYPLGQGAGPSLARAQAIRDAFYHGRSLTNGGTVVTVERTPSITEGRPSGDRYARNVRIRFYSHIDG